MLRNTLKTVFKYIYRLLKGFSVMETVVGDTEKLLSSISAFSSGVPIISLSWIVPSCAPRAHIIF